MNLAYFCCVYTIFFLSRAREGKEGVKTEKEKEMERGKVTLFMFYDCFSDERNPLREWKHFFFKFLYYINQCNFFFSFFRFFF